MDIQFFMGANGALYTGEMLPGDRAATAGEIDAHCAALRMEEIKARLMELDMQSIRPLRALADGTATEEDRLRIAALDVEAEALRTELRGLLEEEPALI